MLLASAVDESALPQCAAPTAEGDSQLDAFHPYACVKRLSKMPARKFNGTDLYLRIHLAQKEGLINVVSEVKTFVHLGAESKTRTSKSDSLFQHAP